MLLGKRTTHEKIGIGKNQLLASVTALFARLVKRIASPERLLGMADVAVVLLAGKARRAERVLGGGVRRSRLGSRNSSRGSFALMTFPDGAKPNSKPSTRSCWRTSTGL